MRFGTAAVATALAPLLAACMALESFQSPEPDEPRTWGGVRRDAAYVGPGFLEGQLALVVIGLVDMPFSAVVDAILLPVTLPRERERLRALEELRRPRAERPSPVAAAGASPAETARALFDTCRQLTQTLDERLLDCYSIDARVTVRTPAGVETVSGAEYKLRLVEALRHSRESGEYVTYREPELVPEGKGVRIRSVRSSNFVGDQGSLSLRVAPGEDGGWRIVEEDGVGWPRVE